ncbi:MAG: hypothetical protein HOB79_05195 [Rhodospirillaceae bacterium]|jgi:hypothetical protein|nr:hypothetical protein [Rhodospirillaceae bacterium]
MKKIALIVVTLAIFAAGAVADDTKMISDFMSKMNFFGKTYQEIKDCGYADKAAAWDREIMKNLGFILDVRPELRATAIGDYEKGKSQAIIRPNHAAYCDAVIKGFTW